MLLIISLLLIAGCCKSNCLNQIEEDRKEHCLTISATPNGEIDTYDYEECINQNYNDEKVCELKCS